MSFDYFGLMRKLYLLCATLICAQTWAQSDNWATVFEKSEGTQTSTYAEGIAYYQRLAAEHATIEMLEMGLTDSGKPLHLVVFSPDQIFDFDALHAQGYTVLLINNAIHAGEVDGIEASQMFLRDLAQKKIDQALQQKVAVAIIPFYNIGGVLNRNSTTRFNQNGPEFYGFRGNARNYDLNRDFIKADSRNAWSFQEIFHKVDPELFLDTHVTNGSDHQFALTLLTTLPEQMGKGLDAFVRETAEPYLLEVMDGAGFDITPYVNVHGRVPDFGWSRFYDSPRYSSGFTSLFQTVGFMSETHALKPYDTRVRHTYGLMVSLLRLAKDHGEELQEVRQVQRQSLLNKETYTLMWQPDPEAEPDMMIFKGYRVDTIRGELTGAPTYRFNREEPYEEEIPIRNAYRAAATVSAPKGYYIPQAWWPIVQRLAHQGVHFDTIQVAQTETVEVYTIADYQSFNSPYEGHYPHYRTQVSSEVEEVTFMPGDYYVPLNQRQNEYIVHVLEPQSRDSFFSWNFFDTILQQKEGPSNYMLEVRKDELTAALPDWEKKWEAALEENPEWKDQPAMLMYWLYQNGPFKEKAHLRYPIYRALR